MLPTKYTFNFTNPKNKSLIVLFHSEFYGTIVEVFDKDLLGLSADYREGDEYFSAVGCLNTEYWIPVEEPPTKGYLINLINSKGD